MPYSTSFDGALDTVVGADQGWTLVGSGTVINLSRLDGSGGLKVIGSASSPYRHVRNEASGDTFVQAVLGENFKSATGQSFSLLLRTSTTNNDASAISLSYLVSGNQLRLRVNGVGVADIASSACVAGDLVRLEAQGDQIRVYLNGALKHTRTDTFNQTETGVGFIGAIGATTLTDVLRSLETGVISAADTDPPVITSLDLNATSPSTLTGSFTSDEAGTATAVLYLASQGDPSDAQVLVGDDVNNDPAVDYILNQAMTAGVNNLLFTGADAETAYKFKVVARDSVPNVAAGVALTGSETTPTITKNASITLYAENGSTPKASVTGLQWAWWDSATPNFSLAPSVSGTGASTNGSGVFSVSVVGSVLAPGQTGTLLIYKTDGMADSTATLAFCAHVVMVS